MTRADGCGVRVAGVGSCVPEGVLTNTDIERMLDTTDEWIVQRTGIRERRIVSQPEQGTFTLSREALSGALENAGMPGSDLDLVIVASVTGEMTCPSVAARVSAELGAAPAGAFDLVAACSGFVYAINVADSLIRSGRFNAIGVVGCDAMSTVIDYSDRSLSILFGDAAGAVVLTSDEDRSLGCQYQKMYSDGSNWESLYMPRREHEIPEWDSENPIRIGCLRMNGREIYKFAVVKLRQMIEEALEATGLCPSQISQFICHQSNLRIIEAAREKLGLPPEKVYININKFGNSSAGSVGLCFDQLWQAGTVKRGDTVLFAAIGGGLTWASSVWKL